MSKPMITEFLDNCLALSVLPIIPFVCYKCSISVTEDNRGFRSKNIFGEQIKNFNSFKCAVCDDNQSFETKSDLDEYNELHESLNCKYCNRNNLKTMKALDEHIKQFHDFKCEFCDDSNETFKNKTALETHIKSIHHQLCEFCDTTDIKTPNDLEEHIKLFHCFKCPFCVEDQTFKTKLCLQEHIEFHHSLKCSYCDNFKTLTKNAMDEHIQLLHKFECQYSVDAKIGKGSFGEIYMGTNRKDSETVAIKLETLSDKKSKPRLSQEYEYYQLLGSHKGIPDIYIYEKFNEKNALVMELLGPNLFDLFKKCGRKFSLSTIKEIGIQVIDRLEYVHSKHLIHCDIKPENILMGCTSSNKENILHLIDFGLSKKYVTSDNGKHIPFKKKKGAGSGTMRYMSVNTHLGYIQSRRDDLESLGYVLVYLMKGKLPWQGLKCKTPRQHKQKVCDMKSSTSIKKLCEDCPEEFHKIMQQYFYYVKNLDFDEKPDYFRVRNFFSQCSNENFKFDWQQSKQQ